MLTPMSVVKVIDCLSSTLEQLVSGFLKIPRKLFARRDVKGVCQL